MRLLTLAWAALLALTGGCASSSGPTGFDAPLPQAKLRAIAEAARTGDRTAIRPLVEQLVSDDPAVRMAAIMALEELTGETLGYCPYDKQVDRLAAVARWVQAVEGGRFDTPATRG